MSVFKVEPNIPSLAWLVDIRGREVRGLVGDRVERFDDGIVEGCWDGEFDDHGFDAAENFFGSGIKLIDGKVHISTATHSLEAVYVHQSADSLVFSNSFPFLVEFTKIILSKRTNWSRNLATVVKGVEEYEKKICVTPDYTISRIVFSDIQVSGNEFSISTKSTSSTFGNFEEYKNQLLVVLSEIFDNAKAGSRTHTYEPISCCTSGYDSNACMALAARLGHREAITLAKSRNLQDDSGRDVGRALGTTVYSREREDVLIRDDFVEAEFLSSGTGGEDLYFGVFEKELRGRILLSGFLGGNVWGLNSEPNTVFRRTDVSGTSIIEFRLRAGFFHVPVPFIGAMGHGDIVQISRSRELEPFSVGGDYDRPIPRRLIEDMGVSRELFGQSKKASSFNVFVFGNTLSPPAQEDFETYKKSNANFAYYVKTGIFWCRYLSFHAGMKIARGIRKFLRLKELEPLKKAVVTFTVGCWPVFFHSSPRSDLLFFWALDKIRPRYETKASAQGKT